jgi:cell division protein FtsW
MINQPPKSVDPILIGLIVTMVVLGFLIFLSASLGQMARSGASFSSVATNQFFFGLIGGSMALVLMSSIHYRHWRKYAFYIFVISIFCTLLVFTPLGVTHGGATRWLDLGITTFQPSEFLKLGFVIYLATWFSGKQQEIKEFKHGLLPFIAIVGLVAFIMLKQPDTDTFLIMAASGLAMFIVAGGRWLHVVSIISLAVLLVVIIAMMRPYVMDRITTFMNSESDPLGSGYQIQQSLIAVGSGGLTGRGYGQSIQKFQYLPEPIGDSIFAVYAEEFGFLGTSILVSLYVFLVLRGYRIATMLTDNFGVLLVVGFMTMLLGQAFLNIGAMIALAPLSGLPLPLVSHGGTALMAVLASLGIVLNVSKYRISRKLA